MLSLLSLLLAFALSPIIDASPASHQSSSTGQSIPLHRRTHVARSTEEWSVWAKAHREMVMSKYGATPVQRRSTGTNLITNQNADSSFFGSLAIGTPPVSYNVILDTGSADLWVAGSKCHTGCGTVATFDASTSSTFKNDSKAFSITYGSGAASGSLGQDVVQMAGFSVANQIFAVCDDVSAGLLNNPVSGLFGLAFQSISSSGATPFWQTLVSGGAWDAPLMAFQLTRFTDVVGAQTVEPGGSFTMGFTNSSLYTGDIEYTSIPSGQESYWILPMTSLTVQGNPVTLPSGSGAYSAIDTGTTLVGGPPNLIAAIYAQIPGSAVGSGNYEGYYTYPCSTTINVTLAFGGRNWPISAADFKLTQITSSNCVGAFFSLDTGSNTPSWIVGDVFLKNVYSVFRYSPAAVGFAALSETALAMNGVAGPAPSPTIGSVAAAVEATGSKHISSDAKSLINDERRAGLVVALVAAMVAACL